VVHCHWCAPSTATTRSFKDYEFSRETVTDLWDDGHDDAYRMIARPDARTATEIGNGCRIYE